MSEFQCACNTHMHNLRNIVMVVYGNYELLKKSESTGFDLMTSRFRLEDSIRQLVDFVKKSPPVHCVDGCKHKRDIENMITKLFE
jgi:hypothetical protein